MAKLIRVLPALGLLGLAMCRDASTVEPTAKSPLSARHDNAPSVQVYRVDFDELNGSGVKARATLQVSGGNLIVTLDANGRIPEHVHPQHIHGFTDKASACPTAANSRRSIPAAQPTAGVCGPPKASISPS